MPTQDEINASTQQQRILYSKINLLNFNQQLVDELSGIVINYDFNIDSNSDIRRTCNITIAPNDSSFNIQEGNKIWIDKYLQIFIGIKSIYTDEIIYTNMGLYLINNPSQIYSAIDNTITIEGVDLMAKLTGLRNGNLEGMTHSIPQGSNIRTSIIAVLKLAGFTKYVVENVLQTVPNDIEIESGGTAFDLLKKINDILPNYQMYFDVDGVFHYDKIPTGENEQIFLDDSIFYPNILIDYKINTPFDEIKNTIEVYGKTHDITYYGGMATLSENIYSITVSDISTLSDNMLIGFTTPLSGTTISPYLKINSLTSYSILNEDGSCPTLENNVYYTMIYKTTYFKFLGGIQPKAIAIEDNSNSPFYVNGTAGVIRVVLSGGEYDNINSDYLAQKRADWELYTRCRLKNTITLTCVPMYYADVNKLIEITLPHNNETNKYIIKNISIGSDIGGNQILECIAYYPYYPTP
jgi:hypothetical protein